MYDVKGCEIASSHQICDEDPKSIITITLLCSVITTASEMFLFDHCRTKTPFVIVVIVRNSSYFIPAVEDVSKHWLETF
jgi:hypothetical protein